MTGRLLTVGKPDHPCVLPHPKPQSGHGAVWQCDTCYKLWRYEGINRGGQGWHRIADPKQKLDAVRHDADTWQLKYVIGDQDVYAYIDARGNWVDAAGKPEMSPDLARLDAQELAERKQPRGFWRIKGDVEQVDLAPPVEGAKHSNGVPDVEVFADTVRTIKDARHLIEDPDGKQVAFGLIIIVLVVVCATVSVLALTGHF
jgi:hypothetical protein